jgi:hypothetical protein
MPIPIRPVVLRLYGQSIETRYFSYASTMNPSAGEVLSTNVLPRMVQRVPVDGWEKMRMRS